MPKPNPEVSPDPIPDPVFILPDHWSQQDVNRHTHVHDQNGMCIKNRHGAKCEPPLSMQMEFIVNELVGLRAELRAQTDPPEEDRTVIVNVDGDLMREVARVQHTKTMQAVLDAATAIPVNVTKNGRTWDMQARNVGDYQTDVFAAVAKIRDHDGA